MESQSDDESFYEFKQLNVKMSFEDVFFKNNFFLKFPYDIISAIIIEKISNYECACLLINFREEFFSVLEKYNKTLNNNIKYYISNKYEKLKNEYFLQLENMENTNIECDVDLYTLITLPFNLEQQIVNVDNKELCKLRNNLYNLKYFSDKKYEYIPNFTKAVSKDTKLNLYIGIKNANEFFFKNANIINEKVLIYEETTDRFIETSLCNSLFHKKEPYINLEKLLELAIIGELTSKDIYNINCTFVNTEFDFLIKNIDVYKPLNKYFSGISFQYILNHLMNQMYILYNKHNFQIDYNQLAKTYVDTIDHFRFICLCNDMFYKFRFTYNYCFFRIKNYKLNKECLKIFEEKRNRLLDELNNDKIKIKQKNNKLITKLNNNCKIM